MAFDRNNPTDLAALVSELQNDPAGLGYATFVASGSPGSLLNLLQLNDPLGAVHTIETFTGEDFLDCLVQSATTASEYNAVVDGFTTASQVPARKMFIEQMLSYKASPIPKRFHARLQAMFTSGLAPTIRAELVSAATGPMSRAEAVFGEGTVLTRDDLRAALASL